MKAAKQTQRDRDADLGTSTGGSSAHAAHLMESEPPIVVVASHAATALATEYMEELEAAGHGAILIELRSSEEILGAVEQAVARHVLLCPSTDDADMVGPLSTSLRAHGAAVVLTYPGSSNSDPRAVAARKWNIVQYVESWGFSLADYFHSTSTNPEDIGLTSTEVPLRARRGAMVDRILSRWHGRLPENVLADIRANVKALRAEAAATIRSSFSGLAGQDAQQLEQYVADADPTALAEAVKVFLEYAELQNQRAEIEKEKYPADDPWVLDTKERLTEVEGNILSDMSSRIRWAAQHVCALQVIEESEAMALRDLEDYVDDYASDQADAVEDEIMARYGQVSYDKAQGVHSTLAQENAAELKRASALVAEKAKLDGLGSDMTQEQYERLQELYEELQDLPVDVLMAAEYAYASQRIGQTDDPETIRQHMIWFGNKSEARASNEFYKLIHNDITSPMSDLQYEKWEIEAKEAPSEADRERLQEIEQRMAALEVKKQDAKYALGREYEAVRSMVPDSDIFADPFDKDISVASDWGKERRLDRRSYLTRIAGPKSERKALFLDSSHATELYGTAVRAAKQSRYTVDHYSGVSSYADVSYFVRTNEIEEAIASESYNQVVLAVPYMYEDSATVSDGQLVAESMFGDSSFLPRKSARGNVQEIEQAIMQMNEWVTAAGGKLTLVAPFVKSGPDADSDDNAAVESVRQLANAIGARWVLPAQLPQNPRSGTYSYKKAAARHSELATQILEAF